MTITPIGSVKNSLKLSIKTEKKQEHLVLNMQYAFSEHWEEPLLLHLATCLLTEPPLNCQLGWSSLRISMKKAGL